MRESSCIETLECRRLLAAGDPDLAFSGDGVATISFPGASFQVNDVAVQSDGKIVAVGTTAGSIAVTRFNVDGTIDTSFGNGGLFESNRRTQATSVAIQQDNKILITFGAGVVGAFRSLAVGRLTANGSGFDSGFGDAGIAFIEGWLTDSGNAVAVQRDGKILVAGEGGGGAGDNMGIARYTPEGLPDSSFDGDGFVEVGFGEEEQAFAVAVDYNGSPVTNPFYGTIVVVGDKRSTQSAQSARFTICRLLPSGDFDDTFDSDGKLTSPDLSALPVEYATGVQIQPGGKIVVTGTAAVGDFSDFLIARYHPHGPIDTSFGPNGTGIAQNDIGFDDQAVDVAPSFLDGFLVSGRSVVAAYTRDGLLDTRFSGDGFMTSFSGVAHIATSGKTIEPIRRLFLGGGNQVGRYIDVGSVVSIRSFDHEAAEAGQDPATFFVQRTQPLETTERVYLSLGGTARPPYLLNADYTVSGMTIVHPIQGRSYIDIPPGDMVAAATITPVNDASPEADETIVLSISSDNAYDISTLSPVTTLAIRDNDATGGPVVSSSAFVYDSGPPLRVGFTFSQNVASSIGANDFSVTGPGGAAQFNFVYDGITNTATLSFSGILADGNYTARAVASGITNASGQPMTADSVLDFFVLAGDADHDRHVNEADSAILVGNLGQSGRTFSQGDFSYDGVVDASDEAILNANWHIWLPPPGELALPASSGNDVYALRRGAGALLDVFAGSDSSPTYRVILDGVTSLLFAGGDGDDTLVLDHTQGDSLPPGIALSFDGAGGNDALRLVGSAAAESAVFNGGSVVLGPTTVNHGIVESRTFSGNGGGDSLTINGGQVALPSTQVLASLSLAAGAVLDVHDHDVILDYSSVSPVGIWTGSAYDGITGYIQSGRIMSSAASGNLKKLGVAEARAALGITGTQTATFSGQVVDSTAALVKFTWGGDANLDGKLNIDDYGRIDSNVSQSGSVWGWFNGDFNYDGAINIDDYGIIDGNMSQQDSIL